MSVLALRLAGPLQSWGASSRFTHRKTEAFPTKSGILGLLAAAEGRRRSDPIEDLLNLELAVRTDQVGVPLRDFHTAHHPISGVSMPLTYRHYWSDAVFTAYVGGGSEIVEGLAEVLSDPRFPLYLGRRSCVPEGRVVLGVFETDVASAVRDTAWQAGGPRRHQLRHRGSVVLPVQADATVYPEETAGRELADVPVSWAPEHRKYRSRMVVDTAVEIPTGHTPSETSIPHDPMAFLGGH